MTLATEAAVRARVRTVKTWLVGVVVAVAGVSSVAANAAAGRDESRESVRTVTYPGQLGRGFTLDHLRGLGRTSPAFKKFVVHRLNYLWGWTDHDPNCRNAAQVDVKRWRSDGFALIPDEGVFGGPGHDECARGGNMAIYLRVKGHWRAPVALGTQEGYACSTLRKYRVPVNIAPGGCYNNHGDYVDYTGPSS